MRVNIDSFNAALRNGGLAETLHEALEILDGPIIDKRAQRTASDAQWERVRDACGPQLVSLLADSQGLGLLKRLSRSDAQVAAGLCSAAQSVLQRLPASGMARS